MSNDATALITNTSATYTLDATIAATDETCPACTHVISQGEMYCPRCGYQRGTWSKTGALGPATVPGARQDESAWMLQLEDGHRLQLCLGDQVIGRGDVELKIDDSFASRRHLKVSVGVHGVNLEDLGSSNGTELEGEMMIPGQSYMLAEGASFRIGQARYRLVAHEAASQAVHKSEAAEIIPSQSGNQVMTEQPSEVADAEVQPLASSEWSLLLPSGEVLLLPVGSHSLGRKPGRCDHVIEGDTFISGLHCRFDASADGLAITDLGSTNGTLVDDLPIEANVPVALRAGSKVRIGQTDLLIATSAPPGVEEAVPTPST